jgi:peptide/nickel transport system ATP-binding protein
VTPLVELQGVHVHFPVRRRGARAVEWLRAVDGVDLVVEAGEGVGIVGESGCGKSTLARVIVGLQEPTSGSLVVAGERTGANRSAVVRRRVQMVFQDPATSLNPRRSVRSVLAELLRAHGLATGSEAEARVRALADLVGLPRRTLGAQPRELSGGERQRVAIARALAVEPDVLVADEAVASLDVSVQAAVINLLADLRRQLGLTLVFISHDLGVVRSLCDRVAVMYLGRIVEDAPAELLFAGPGHPYTRALLAAVPRLGEGGDRRAPALEGEPPSPLAVPPGCRFHPRCPVAVDVCHHDEPPVVVDGPHSTACVHAAAPGASRQ